MDSLVFITIRKHTSERNASTCSTKQHGCLDDVDDEGSATTSDADATADTSTYC